MKQFFLDILSGKENTPGSKRFTSIWTLGLFTITVIFHLITKQIIQGEILILEGTIILTPLGINALQSIKAMSTKSEVATSIAKEDPSVESSDAAKQVLTNDKPHE